MRLFINQGIIVTASQRADSSYSYNTVTVVFLTEATKLLSSIVIFLKDNEVSTLISNMKQHLHVMGLYMVPALLYCLYNNLAFVNLAAFDPTTYFLLLQLRVVLTGIIFQVVFKKQLSRYQWVSLIILTLGCVIKQLSSIKKEEVSPTHTVSILTTLLSNVVSLHIFLMLVQVWQLSVIAIILNNAAVGIVTSFFLRSLNSILKTFASALELMFTAVLSWIIFGIPIDWWTAAAIALVIYATYMYAQNPVVNRGRLDVEKGSSSQQEEEMLVISEIKTSL
ncbi:UDP-galactose transporter senju isoform X4 [Cherax quadricarinatus]